MMRYYTCPKCGDFPFYRNDSVIMKKCPGCGTAIKQRLGGNFTLKGSGFYSTDNKAVR